MKRLAKIHKQTQPGRAGTKKDSTTKVTKEHKGKP